MPDNTTEMLRRIEASVLDIKSTLSARVDRHDRILFGDDNEEASGLIRKVDRLNDHDVSRTNHIRGLWFAFVSSFAALLGAGASWAMGLLPSFLNHNGK